MLQFTPPKDISLRPYQLDALDALRAGIAKGNNRQVLCAPTGAGKTILATDMLRHANNMGNYAVFLMDRVALVDQSSAVLDEYGVPHGVLQGSHDRFSPFANVQVASIQTLAKRQLPRQPKLILYDECHAQYKSTLEWITSNPQAKVIGLSATPFAKGMGEFWDDVINVTTAMKLVDEGFLILPKIYVARTPNEADFKLNNRGEFSDASAASAGIEIIGDVVEEWERKVHEHFGGPAKTIVFSPTVEHGRELCAAFSAAGYNFQQISYLDRGDDERRAKIAEFRRPDTMIHGLVSCGVLTKGFDVPDCVVGISCKPYRKSLSSHLQEIGRIMRTHPSKQMALWLCHSGNIARFAPDMWDIWENGVTSLSKAAKKDSEARSNDDVAREKAVCPECGGGLRHLTCRECGWEKPARSSIITVEGTLQEYSRAETFQARDGLKAKCLNDPHAVWRAALAWCGTRAKGGETGARKWAFKTWKSIYPTGKLGRGAWDLPIPQEHEVGSDALGLIQREQKR
ncbi:MAG: DEAD/DEAH box helicase family protein, partial [Pseudomonadota bacterium]